MVVDPYVARDTGDSGVHGLVADSPRVQFPPKHSVFGVQVSETSYEDCLQTLILAAQARLSATVDHMPVHGLIEASRDPELRAMLNGFDIVAPDGHPVRFSLNQLHGTQLADRVYGPELMQRLCAAAAQTGVGIYLYGSTPEVLDALRANLERRFPGLGIQGSEAPPFRELTPEEDRAVVERINQSGAGLVFIGLGCPKQEVFAAEHRQAIQAVQICVGAAFDFLAGTKRMAPRWMQERSLEWLFRLVTEPRRLWKRYVVTNSIFLVKLAGALVSGAGRRAP